MQLFVPAIIAGVALTLNHADALNVKLFGVNYSIRKGAEWAAYNVKCKSEAEVQKDMEALSAITERVRINSLLDCNVSSLLLPAAKKAGLRVHLGIWMTKGDDQFLAEKNKLSSLIDSGLYDENVIALDVGSLAISQEHMDADIAISHLMEIREYIRGRGHDTPVTIAETIDIYTANPKIIDAVDFVNVIYYSINERADGNEGASLTLDRIRALRLKAESVGKRTEIAETGWSSNGVRSTAGVASAVFQARYVSDMHQVSVSNQLHSYWYTSHDQPYRLEKFDANFGLMFLNNTLKPNIKQLTIPDFPRGLIQNEATKSYLSESLNDMYMWGKSKTATASEEQVWTYDPVNEQFRCQSNLRCLDAYQPQERGAVHMFRCIDTERNQKWKLDTLTGQLKHVIHTGFCLDVDRTRSDRVQLSKCSTERTQKWLIVEDSRAYQLA